MRIIIVLIIGIAFSNMLKSQSEYLLVWDKNASSITSAENLITLHKGLYDFKDKYLKRSYWNENNWKGKSLGVGYRFLKTLLIDIQFDYLTVVHQHEVFGHGARYREFGLRGNSYHIPLAPPYGSGKAFAKSGTATNRQFGAHEYIARTTGGMEGSAILAKRLRDKWLLNEEINYQESTLFLSSFNDYTLYILSTKLFDNNGDVQNYLKRINATYGFLTENTYQLSLNEISKRAVINLFDTYQLFALYTYFKVYLFDGNESFKIPMIRIGNIKFLPSIRLGLTPFGSEFIFESHFVRNKNLLELSFRLGDNKLESFWGGGFKIRKNISNLLVIQTKVNIWNQPNMTLGDTTTFQTNDGFGGSVSNSLSWQINQKIPVGFYAEIAYKTTGFIEGEQLDKGLIFRIGLLIRD